MVTLKTAFWTTRSRDSSIELAIKARRPWSRASFGLASVMSSRIALTLDIMVSVMCDVSVCSLRGASFLSMASVSERHWFIGSGDVAGLYHIRQFLYSYSVEEGSP
jgi:hypothetical protein